MSRTSSSRRRPPASRPKLARKKPVPKKRVPRKPAPKKPIPQTPVQRELTTKRRGELAELAFTLKAYQLGFGVSKPYGDSERYDVIVDPRELLSGPCRDGRLRPSPEAKRGASTTNLKCPAPTSNPRKLRGPRRAAIPPPPNPSPPLWRVQVKCTAHLLEGFYHLDAERHTGGRAVPYLPGEIDFLAAYILLEDTWYIIPHSAFLGRTSLLFRRRDDPKPGLYDAYREAWPLLRPKPQK